MQLEALSDSSNPSLPSTALPCSIQFPEATATTITLESVELALRLKYDLPIIIVFAINVAIT